MPRGQRTTDRDRTGRRSAAPLGVATPKLRTDPEPGFHQHWFNDTGSRLQDAYGNDYEFVVKSEGDGEDAREVKVSKRVGTNEDGSPQIAYLMKKREDWYRADQREKAKPNDEVERAIRSGKPMGGTQEAEAYYNAGSSIKTGT